MLDKLGFKKRIHVGITISSNNTIELTYINAKSKSVESYATGEVKYNNAVRELIDLREFTEVVLGLFEEADLAPEDCSVSLTLPNVYFGMVPLESSNEREYIIENLQTELEDLYIFKKNEPIISYSIGEGNTKSSNKNIVYGAIQSKSVSDIIDTFDNMGIELERIDTSYSSIIKAVQYTDRFAQYVLAEEKTTLFLVTANNICSFGLKNGNVFNFNEQPVAVKSFSPEEVFTALSAFISGMIKEDNPSSIIIVSETAEVAPDLLKERIEFSGSIDCLGIITNENDMLINTEAAADAHDNTALQTITLEAIGSAVSAYENYSLDINFLPLDRIKSQQIVIGGYEIELKRFLVICIVTALLLGAVLGFILKTILTQQAENQQTQNAAASKEIKNFETRLNKGGGDSQMAVFPLMQKIINNNKAVINAYMGLSTEIPDSIYIKKFITNANGGVGIIGEAAASEDVERFVSKLKEKNEYLMVSKISVNTKNDPIPAKIPNGFTFEIKTSNVEVNLYEDEMLQNSMQNVYDAVKQKGARKSQTGSSGTALTPPPAPVI